MGYYTVERLLTICYSIATLFGFLTTVTTAIAYNYWKDSLNKCLYPRIHNYVDPYAHYEEGEHCGCLLYSSSLTSEFRGGIVSTCSYVIYAPIPVIIYVIILAGIHFIRVCINKNGKQRARVIERRMGEIVVETSEDRSDGNSINSKICIALAITSGIFAIYMLVHASILSDGYRKTCNEYRKVLIKEFNAQGNHQAAIYDRLSCTAIYDFMDYLMPGIRDNFINTPICMTFAISSSWLMVITLTVISVLNVKLARINRLDQ